MQNSLITTLLATFTKTESRDFGRLLLRPERRIRKDVVLLGELLLGERQAKTPPATESTHPPQ